MKDTSKQKFIVTTFAETARKLEELGFILLSHSGNNWTFLNNATVNFAEMKKCAYTDRINI